MEKTPVSGSGSEDTTQLMGTSALRPARSPGEVSGAALQRGTLGPWEYQQELEDQLQQESCRDHTRTGRDLTNYVLDIRIIVRG